MRIFNLDPLGFILAQGKRGNLCTPHYTRQDKLEADVLAASQLQVKAALNYDKLLAKLRNSEGERSIRDQQNALLTSLNLKLSGISKKRTRLYEDFTEGVLDEEEYAFAKKAYDEQYVDLSRRLDVYKRQEFDTLYLSRILLKPFCKA